MTIGMRLFEAALPVHLLGFHKPNISPCREMAVMQSAHNRLYFPG